MNFLLTRFRQLISLQNKNKICLRKMKLGVSSKKINLDKDITNRIKNIITKAMNTKKFLYVLIRDFAPINARFNSR